MPSLFKKKNKSVDLSDQQQPPMLQHASANAPAPPITILRTTTDFQEIISPPGPSGPSGNQNVRPESSSSKRRSLGLFRKHGHENAPTESLQHQSLRERLHLSRSRSASTSSVNLPENLPEEPSAAARTELEQSEWEKRATLLAEGNSVSKSATPSGRPVSAHGVSDGTSDANIQEAIRLHEAGDLPRSTRMFGQLADPDGANNALSQVLYGLALR
jgi:hypothetical protein